LRKMNNVAAANLFVSVILLMVIFSVVDHVYLPDENNDDMFGLDNNEKIVLWENRLGSFLDDTNKSTWVNMTHKERQDLYSSYHGGDPYRDFTMWWDSPYDDCWGYVFVFPDGTYLSWWTWQVSFALSDDPNTIYEDEVEPRFGLWDILEMFWSIVTINFRFFDYMGWFAWVIKIPLMLGLLYSIVKAMPFTGG